MEELVRELSVHSTHRRHLDQDDGFCETHSFFNVPCESGNDAEHSEEQELAREGIGFDVVGPWAIRQEYS